jgi:Spy/CpxP family protein refolding chaperone
MKKIMKQHQLIALLCASVLLIPKTASADETATGDPLAERLFPPDLILHNGEAIGLSDEKRQEVMSCAERAQARFQELEQALLKEREALVALLDRGKADEPALVKQLDNVIARESDIRKEQFRLMLSLRKLLTAEQQARLNQLRKTHNPSALEARLKEKVARVEAGLQKTASNGGNPSSIAEKMQPFPELMRVGKVQEAEALLDKVLRELEAK